MAYQILTRGGKVGGDILEYLIKQADPRFGNQVGSSDLRKGEIALLPETRVTVEGAQDFNLPPVDFRNYEGRGLITSMSDKTAAGGRIVRVDDQNLSRPVLREGGQNFMFANPDDALWASFPSVIDDHLELANFLRGKTGGKDPLFAPWSMTPQGMDYSTMPVNVMLGFIDSSASNRLKNAITQKVRQTVPEFVGFKGDWEKQIFQMSGKQRKALQKALDSVRSDTGIGSGKGRVSVADPDQLILPEGSLFNVGEFGKDVSSGGRVHGTYKGSTKGTGLGRTSEPVMVTQAIPETVDKKGVVRKVADPSNPTSDDLRSMMMGPKGAIIDEKMLRRMYGSGAGLAILGALTGNNAEASTAGINEIMARRMNPEPVRIPEEFWTQGNGIGVAQAPAQNPVSQGAEYIAGKLHAGGRALDNAGILSLLGAPLHSLGDIASRAAYGESKVTDPAEALLSASAFVPQLYFGGKTLNAMRDKDIQSMLFRQVFGD